MKNIDNLIEPFYSELESKRKSMNWLIRGLGRTGLNLSDIKFIDWGWVREYYNVN